VPIIIIIIVDIDPPVTLLSERERPSSSFVVLSALRVPFFHAKPWLKTAVTAPVEKARVNIEVHVRAVWGVSGIVSALA
jgi:hypothetical protein